MRETHKIVIIIFLTLGMTVSSVAANLMSVTVSDDEISEGEKLKVTVEATEESYYWNADLELVEIANAWTKDNKKLDSGTLTFDGFDGLDETVLITDYETLESTLPNDGVGADDDAEICVKVDGDKSNMCPKTVDLVEESSDPNNPAKANFYVSPDPPVEGEEVTFNAQNSVDKDGGIQEFAWDWDSDGEYEKVTRDAIVEHTFDDVSGSREVELRVKGPLMDNGEYDKAYETETLDFNQRPEPVIDISPSNPQVDSKNGRTEVSFDGLSSSDDGYIDSYDWEISENGDLKFSSEGYNFDQRLSAGNYNVMLEVTDGQGLSESTQKSFTVEEFETNDSDNDGVANYKDECSGTPPGANVDSDGCAVDSDGDGYKNYEDKCPNTGDQGYGLKDDGCPVKDSDGDGVPNNDDECPNTGDQGYGLKSNGCPVKDSDEDGDGVSDSKDQCPGTPSGANVDSSGCAVDSDGDDIPDYKDNCPYEYGENSNGCPAERQNDPPVANLDISQETAKVGEEIKLDAFGSYDSDGELNGLRLLFEPGGSIDKPGTVDEGDFVEQKSFDEPGNYKIKLEVEDNDGAVDRDVEQITVEEKKDDPDPPGSSFPGKYDENNDGKIQVEEMQKGMDKWASGSLSLSKVQKLISLWGSQEVIN